MPICFSCLRAVFALSFVERFFLLIVWVSDYDCCELFRSV